MELRVRTARSPYAVFGVAAGSQFTAITPQQGFRWMGREDLLGGILRRACIHRLRGDFERRLVRLLPSAFGRASQQLEAASRHLDLSPGAHRASRDRFERASDACGDAPRPRLCHRDGAPWCRGQQSYTSARQMIHHLRAIIANDGPATVVVDDQTHPSVERAQGDEGFRPEGSAWKAVVQTGVFAYVDTDTGNRLMQMAA